MNQDLLYNEHYRSGSGKDTIEIPAGFRERLWASLGLATDTLHKRRNM